MKKFYIFILFFTIALISKAGIVPIETAKTAAINFYTQHVVKDYPEINQKEIIIKDANTIYCNNLAVYYIYFS